MVQFNKYKLHLQGDFEKMFTLTGNIFSLYILFTIQLCCPFFSFFKTLCSLPHLAALSDYCTQWSTMGTAASARWGRNQAAPCLGKDQRTEQIIWVARLGLFKILFACQDLVLQKIIYIKSNKFKQTKWQSICADSVCVCV